MMSKKILIVEDEEDIIELISYSLKKEGFSVNSLTSGSQVLNEVGKNRPDVILLDLMLPGMDGLDVCRALKQKEATRDIPIIMISAKSDDVDVVLGLELGADDYVTKPFSPKVLVARVKSVFRREQRNGAFNKSSLVSMHGLNIDPVKHEIKINGEILDLTYSEFQTLHLLATHAGRVFTRYQIVEEVHGHNYEVTDRSIDVLMVGLRKKLGDSASVLETIRGVGYRFKE